jgi:hypothetical protein
MKLHEITNPQFNQERLDELNLKHALASGIAAGSLMGSVGHQAPKEPVRAPLSMRPSAQAPKAASYQMRDRRELEQTRREQSMVDNITKKYKTTPELAKRIVDVAHENEDPTFPKAADLLSLIGIESSFKPSAVSGLKKDPAVGLMQVRPGMWGIEPEDIDDIEEQIKHGAHVLKTYYAKLGDKESAIKAYNVGLRGFRNKLNPDAADRYFSKYSNEYDTMYAAL